jgi:hypothetical protein
MACNCIELTNEALVREGHNTKLGLDLFFSGRPAQIGLRTQLIEKKRGATPIRMIATHCPFCGVLYETEGARP